MGANKKIYVALVSFLAIILLLTTLVVYPLFGAIQKNSQELVLAKTREAQLVQESESRAKSEALYKKYKTEVEAMENVFVDPDVPLGLITFLEQAAVNSGANLTILSVAKKPQVDDPWPSLLLRLSVKSLPTNFLEFLERVEASPYLIEVLDLTLKGDEANLAIKVFTR